MLNNHLFTALLVAFATNSAKGQKLLWSFQSQSLVFALLLVEINW